MKKSNGLPGRPKGSTADRPKSRPGRPPGACKICDYAKKHKNCDLNRRLVEGASARSIAKEYGFGEHLVAKHMKEHLSKRLKSAANAREAKKGLDLLECQKAVYEKSMKAAGMALGEIDTPATANLSAFGSCIGPATKVVEVLAKIDDKPQVNQTTTVNNYDNLSKEELRELVALTAKIEGSEEGSGEEKSD